MIGLTGLVSDEDIEIRFTGLRPGEKLFEELCTEGEDIERTSHEKIKIVRGTLRQHCRYQHGFAMRRSLFAAATVRACSHI